MSQDYIRSRLLGITSVVSDYCLTLENVRESSKEDFIIAVTSCLPKIYLEFCDLVPPSEIESDDTEALVDFDMRDEFFASYVDEDYYESVRRGIESLLGPDDVFLETFEEDMKYSDTPIAASISESLADIFQPLYNFLSIVRDSEGEHLTEAYRQCREDFVSYWSQTLCNVMRPLNNLRFN